MALLKISLLITGVAAYDLEAHDAIGQTAASAMDQKAIKQVKRLLGGKDVSDVAGWGHQVDDMHPDIAKLHFQPHTGEYCGPKDKRSVDCKDSLCLLSAIKHLYGKILQDEGRSMNYPALDFNKVAPGLKMTDADAVKLLINLIGDLHQPFHVGFAETDAGKKMKVRFRGKELSLYEFWDSEISNVIRRDEANFWLSGWTHIRKLPQYTAEKESWTRDGAYKSFERWLDEMVDFTCTFASTHPQTHQPLWGAGASTGIIDITEPAYQQLKQGWLHQILLAGGRTAIVLNEILDDSGAAKLSMGSKIKTKEDQREEEEKKEWAKERAKVTAETKHKQAKVKAPWDIDAFLTNLGITLIVVPTFLCVVNYGLKPSVYIALLKSLTEASSGNAEGQQKSKSSKRWD